MESHHVLWLNPLQIAKHHTYVSLPEGIIINPIMNPMINPIAILVISILTINNNPTNTIIQAPEATYTLCTYVSSPELSLPSGNLT